MEPAPVAGRSIGKNTGPTFVLHRNSDNFRNTGKLQCNYTKNPGKVMRKKDSFNTISLQTLHHLLMKAFLYTDELFGTYLKETSHTDSWLKHVV